MSNEKEKETTYTIEFKTKQSGVKRNTKKLLLSILLIVIVAISACSLVFGIGIAKKAI